MWIIDRKLNSLAAATATATDDLQYVYDYTGIANVAGQSRGFERFKLAVKIVMALNQSQRQAAWQSIYTLSDGHAISATHSHTHSDSHNQPVGVIRESESPIFRLKKRNHTASVHANTRTVKTSRSDAAAINTSAPYSPRNRLGARRPSLSSVANISSLQSDVSELSPSRSGMPSTRYIIAPRINTNAGTAVNRQPARPIPAQTAASLSLTRGSSIDDSRMEHDNEQQQPVNVNGTLPDAHPQHVYVINNFRQFHTL